MLSSGDQQSACDLAAKIRDSSLVRPVILIREDQYGTVTLTPVDRADNNATMRVHMNVGQRLPMYISALGRSLAAHSGLSRSALRERVDVLRWSSWQVCRLSVHYRASRISG